MTWETSHIDDCSQALSSIVGPGNSSQDSAKRVEDLIHLSIMVMGTEEKTPRNDYVEKRIDVVTMRTNEINDLYIQQKISLYMDLYAEEHCKSK